MRIAVDLVRGGFSLVHNQQAALVEIDDSVMKYHRDKMHHHAASEKFLLTQLESQQSATYSEIPMFSRVLARKRGGCIVFVCRQF
ncbi:hypothetical protein [Bradyrhizobium yuanmingense]|uniref:hypothetical protein n=1 Tax=Bradyrhizobium yuanmingense TaxID=108015 RepID=UPI0023B88867|nr:hypothetical protein [Bradyrhizobium yuanmingense]MDF0580581.1 hypothetical protein [Bradyrhizobium yuanmingense]